MGKIKEYENFEEYVKNYTRENLSKMTVCFRKNEGELVEKIAKEQGFTTRTKFITFAVKEYIKANMGIDITENNQK